MATYGSKLRFFSKLFFIALGFTLSISSFYVVLAQTLFRGHKNYYVLILGLFGAYISAGYVGFNLFEGSTLGKKMLLGMACGLGVAVIVLYLSMFLMLNLRGS